MKLFEIPVYALSKEKLEKCVKQKCEKLKKSAVDSNSSDENLKYVIEHETFPQRLWDYNHIIEYMVLSIDGADIVLDLFAPFERKKYYWYSSKKQFLQDQQLKGYHNNISSVQTGDQLRNKINSLINEYVRTVEKCGYYVDLEAYKNIDAVIDYGRLLESIGHL